MNKIRVLLTGASSYVGARLFMELEREYDVFGTYSSHQLHSRFLHLDTTSRKETEAIISKIRPEVIIHAAANANARWCEANKVDAVKLNERATEHIVSSANAIGAQVIYISSYAAIHPANVYGWTKRRSEEIVKTTENAWVILRPSLILGFSPNTINDRPFNRLLRNLDQGTPAVYDTSWSFQPTYIKHLSDVAGSLIRQKVRNTIIPVACPELTTRYQSARDILTPFDIKVEGVDKKEAMETAQEDLSILFKLKLPQCSYREMTLNIIEEIRMRHLFVYPPVT